MSDASDAPDWFGNIINNWILLFLVGIIAPFQYAFGFWSNLFGMNDFWAGIYRGFKDLLPPLVKEGGTFEKEMPKAPKPYWA